MKLLIPRPTDEESAVGSGGILKLPVVGVAAGVETLRIFRGAGRADLFRTWWLGTLAGRCGEKEKISPGDTLDDGLLSSGLPAVSLTSRSTLPVVSPSLEVAL